MQLMNILQILQIDAGKAIGIIAFIFQAVIFVWAYQKKIKGRASIEDVQACGNASKEYTDKEIANLNLRMTEVNEMQNEDIKFIRDTTVKINQNILDIAHNMPKK